MFSDRLLYEFVHDSDQEATDAKQRATQRTFASIVKRISLEFYIVVRNLDR